MDKAEEEINVSIIIVSYNYEEYVERAIHSALNQTYENIQVIAVDDGSTDRSRERLTAFASRVELVFKTNGGETSAVNTGFSAARGDIILFLDSDDELAPTAIEEVVAVFRPGTAKVQFRLDVVDAAGRSLGNVIPFYPKDYSRETVAQNLRDYGIYPSPPSSGNAYARAFLSRVMPLDVDLFPFAPDGALNAIAPLYGDVVSIDRPLGRYRIHGRNMWATDTLDPQRFLEYLVQGNKEVAYLRAHAAKLGRTISRANPLDHSLQFLERRLTAKRLFPHHLLVSGERPMQLFLQACRCIGRYEQGIVRRLSLLAWFLLIAVVPPPLHRTVINYRYTPRSRPGLVRALIKRSKPQTPDSLIGEANRGQGTIEKRPHPISPQ